MSETITRAQLVELAADELGVSSIGQSLAVEDAEKIDGAIDSLLSRLAVEQICYVADADETPRALADQLAVLLAEQCARSFGGQRDNAVKMGAEMALRRAVALSPTYEPMKAEYF